MRVGRRVFRQAPRRMIEVWLAVLLAAPLAAWLGWILAIRFHGRSERRKRHRISSNYFRGLNYLLNEQPDKAIEVFLKLAEVNRDTVETHLALGNLFRRRGEVDKAIRFHRHIVGRPNLSERHRFQALLELGEDYMRAGLLDRAERLYAELPDEGPGSEVAIRNLLSIYQQEKDWRRAIEQAERLRRGGRDGIDEMVAQFYCELALDAERSGDRDGARQALRTAREHHSGCARSWLIEGELARAEQRWREAATHFLAACELDPDLIVLVIDELVQCHVEDGRETELLPWLAEMGERGRTLAPVLAMTRIQAREEPRAAIETLLGALESRPTVRGVQHLLELIRHHDDAIDRIDPELLRRLMQRLMQDQPRFRCRQCGFSGQTWHWQCPSCREWGTTRPVEGVIGV